MYKMLFQDVGLSTRLILVLNATFSYIMATSYSGGRSCSTRREPPTMGKQLANFIMSRVHLFCKLQSWAQTHAALVMWLV
jgi:hypothetical protein